MDSEPTHQWKSRGISAGIPVSISLKRKEVQRRGEKCSRMQLKKQEEKLRTHCIRLDNELVSTSKINHIKD